MIYYLAALPKEIFVSVKNIFNLYSRGDLKGQKISRSKAKACKDIDLKGSSFKCLRGVSILKVKELLQQVADCELSMSELSAQCCSVKHMEKIKSGFMKGTNCQSWEEAVAKFPGFASEAMLEPFKRLNFNSPKIPDDFMSYCKKAVTSKSRVGKNCITEIDNLAIFEYQECIGMLLKQALSKLNPPTLFDAFKEVNP